MTVCLWDYKNASNDEDSDSDYEPELPTKKPRIPKPKKTKPVIKETPVILPKSETELQVGEVVGVLYAEPSKAGRPRKNRYLKMDAGDLDRTPASIEVDRKLDEIVKNCQQEIKKREAEESQSIRKRGRGRPRGMFWKKIWICPDCGKEFNQRANLRTHLFVHTDEKPFACHIEGCDKHFRTNEGRRRHHLSHQGIKPFECDICQNKFTSQVALNEHKSRHSDEKPFQCPHCEKRFRQVSCYKRHLATHSDKQPYKCVICQRQFAQPAYLRSHMKVHTGEKPYKCETCGKQFSHQSDVKRHQTTHTGEKPYACGKCNARFTDVSSKNRHEKEHENVKRYTCHLCSETFKRQGQLRAHLDRRHNTHSFSFSLNSEKQQNNDTLITLKPGEENNTTNNNSVFLNQRRILDIIKNFQNKGGTEIDNIEFVSLPEANVAQTEVSSLGTDISQLEREVNASVIDGDVGVPIELHGVEVQAEDTDHTYITISSITGAWNQNEETETTSTHEYYQKVEVITETGEKKELLLPYNPDNPDGDIHVDYTSIIDQSADVVTVNTEQGTYSTQIGEAPVTVDVVESSTGVSEQAQNDKAVVDNASANDNVDSEQANEAQTTGQTEGVQSANSAGDKDLVNVQVEDIETVAVENIVIDEGSIVSLNENFIQLNESENKSQSPQSDHIVRADSYKNTEQIKETEQVSETIAETKDKQGDEDVNSEGVTNASVEKYDKTSDSNKESVDNDEQGLGDDGEDDLEDSVIDFVANPDFSSQDYYNWLSKFTELCKVVPMPLDMPLFQKISQVHKTLSDVMANPSGVVADRENFRVLMNISRELSTIINEHLFFVLGNLKEESSGNCSEAK